MSVDCGKYLCIGYWNNTQHIVYLLFTLIIIKGISWYFQ